MKASTKHEESAERDSRATGLGGAEHIPRRSDFHSPVTVPLNWRFMLLFCRVAFRPDQTFCYRDHRWLDHDHVAARRWSPCGHVHTVLQSQEFGPVDCKKGYQGPWFHDPEKSATFHGVPVPCFCAEPHWDQQTESFGWVHNFSERFVLQVCPSFPKKVWNGEKFTISYLQNTPKQALPLESSSQ